MFVLFLIIKIFHFPRGAHPRSIIRVREIYNLRLARCNPCRVDRSLSSPLVRFTALVYVCMHCTAPGTTPHDFSRLISYLRQIDVWVFAHIHIHASISVVHLPWNASISKRELELKLIRARTCLKDDQEIGN